MKFTGPIKSPVFNRGTAPDSFLSELIEWGKASPEDIFAPNALSDIYLKVCPELGPWVSPLHRRAAMLEVMRVLAGFESSWDWTEGVDESRMGRDTFDNSEAGAWQVSYDGRFLADGLVPLLVKHDAIGAIKFQRAMKSNHPLAMEFVARLMRGNTRHNGPLYKARNEIRKSLRGPEHSIYPWLKREAVAQFMNLLLPS